MSDLPARRHPTPGELQFHIKWIHGAWVPSGLSTLKLEEIHAEVHEPPGLFNCEAARHRHEAPAVETFTQGEDVWDMF